MVRNNIIARIAFITELDTRVLKDNSFRLLNNFVVSVLGQLVIIPEGFETDFASIPRLPFVYRRLGNRGHKAAVLHDWLYATNAYPRNLCDYFFYYALIESGIGYLDAKLMYTGVRLGGADAYNTYTVILEEQALIIKHNKKRDIINGRRIENGRY